ncbi:MAG: methanogenesis marker 2 protein [Methanocellales archaeon]
MQLEKLARSLREFEGVTRKRTIGALVSAFHVNKNKIIASFGEDAAVIDFGEKVLLLAADGIWSKLMKADPFWAGYCSVLVNIHDIAAMGGEPIAMVNVFSVSSKEICKVVSQGMSKAVKKFDVPMVGGHVHPDTPYDSIDVAILGIARKDSVIYSHTAQIDDDILIGIDLDGRIHPSFQINWDSTTHKDTQTLKKQLKSMQVLGEAHLVNAGKDISNPGTIGSLGMILEISGVGAIVDLERIPRPENLELEQWLKMYPGMGFIVTAKPENSAEVIKVFEAHGLKSEKIGKIVKGSKLEVTYNGKRATVFDFKIHKITGLKPVRCGRF